MMDHIEGERFKRAAAAIRDADALLIGAGAGMGVDSGLPDFRGNDGFWNAYPPFRELGLSFIDLANPAWLRDDPELAWGFYGHRLHLYRTVTPHAGFELLRRWGEAKPRGYFVFTSNVDEQFQSAGFDPERIIECHGSIHRLQCTRPCSIELWRDADTHVDVDPATFRAAGPLPVCPRCGALARPNLLMFDDYTWIEAEVELQQDRYREWLRLIRGARLAIIECGAGLAIPTVRRQCEQQRGTLIRINLRESGVPASGISVPCRVVDGLQRIEEFLEAS